MSYQAPTTGLGRVLVVEDDADLSEFLHTYLGEHGFEVVVAQDGFRALEMADQGVDLILLDLNLPGPDGFEVLRRVREYSPIPIIIVSARSEGPDRVTGLELGADDYLVKPFLPRELLARTRALMRRARLPAARRMGNALIVEPEARRVLLDDRQIDLTPLEYSLLRTMALAPGKSFSREELLEEVWGPGEAAGDVRRVDLYISKLRAKLDRPGKPVPIQSVWGVGYRFEA
ncbi:MAG: response regulator transcription factor [Candidatus Eremiobacteraeota bacterium]|nr:response regulator transcription factor [Candidatus Eremiobacteraeota bacterium]